MTRTGVPLQALLFFSFRVYYHSYLDNFENGRNIMERYGKRYSIGEKYVLVRRHEEKSPHWRE